MTDNQFKIEVLKMALEIARETMYNSRAVIEGRWERRTTEEEFPELPSLSVQEVVNNYRTIMNNVAGQG